MSALAAAAAAPTAPGDGEEPVTVVVTRRVKAGREAAYEAWLERLIRDAAALPGFLGAKVARPSIRGPRCALADAAATSART